MSSVTEPSVPRIACPFQMAWAITFIGMVVCVPRFMRRISRICSGMVSTGWVKTLKPEMMNEPLWNVPETGTQPMGKELEV
jgi:phage baseplate assembly protein gpV